MIKSGREDDFSLIYFLLTRVPSEEEEEEEEVFIYLQTKKNKNNLFTGDVLPISRLFLP